MMSKKEEYVELTIAQEQEIPHPSGALRPPILARYVKVPKKLYRELSKKYGDYVMNWVFVDADTIKVRKGLGWDYKHIASEKIKQVF